MSQTTPNALAPLAETPVFVDRRNPRTIEDAPGRERRQFTNTYEDLTPAGQELATAIDAYKMANRRRFVNFDEMVQVIESLGYRKTR